MRRYVNLFLNTYQICQTQDEKKIKKKQTFVDGRKKIPFSLHYAITVSGECLSVSPKQKRWKTVKELEVWESQISVYIQII